MLGLLLVGCFVATGGVSDVRADQGADCDRPVRHLQVSYRFLWDETDQARFVNRYQGGCSSPAFLARLTDDLTQDLAQSQIDVRHLSIMPVSQTNVVVVKIVTDDDLANKAAADFSVIFPLKDSGTGKVITSLEILGDARENEELVARYTVNETAYQQGGGKLTLQWLRDGQIIEGAGKSRYRLVREDVGARISALLSYGSASTALSDKILADSAFASARTDVAAANYPPSIKDLRIDGEAVTGAELVASYEFVDENPADEEGESRFIWLRDNIAIAEATGPSYQTSAKDIGAQITVRVVPVTKAGEEGKARSVTLAQRIAPAAIIADAEVVENIVKEDAEKLIDAKTLEKSIEAALAQPKVTIAKPKKRPAVPQKAPVEQVAKADDADETGEQSVQEQVPALVITPDDKTDEVAQTQAETTAQDEVTDQEQITQIAPPVVLTPGFEIAATSPKTFTNLRFTPSGILMEHELKSTKQVVVGTPITLEAIKTVLDDVNGLYLAKGFELSRALLPEQTVTDGVVTIQLVEATVGQITLENINNLDPEFVRAHLAAKEGDFISLAALEKSIRLYNLSNRSNLATELAPGENFGETDIFVDVAEPDRVELPTISINNYANQTSDWRQNALSISLNNVIGIDDETSLSFSDSDGSTTMSGSVSVPVNERGRNVSLALSKSDTKIVAGSAETVGYRGSSHSMVATLSEPLYFGDDYSFYLSGTYGVSKSDLVQPVTGALLTESEVRKFSVSVPYSYNNGTTALSVSPSWHVLNVITKIPEKEKWVQKVNVDASASHFLTDKWTLNGRANLLYTDAIDMINMPSEILSVGGPNSVRAYQPAESSGYQGYFVSGELRTDLANWEQISMPDFMPSAQGYVFLDHMMAQSQYNVRSRADYWSGYGVGLQIPSIFNLLTFDIYWSEALDGDVHEEEKEFYDDELFQFSLSARFRLQ